MKHIHAAVENKKSFSKSPITLERGLETMLVIAASHISAKNNCSVSIDYSKGFNDKAFSF